MIKSPARATALKWLGAVLLIAVTIGSYRGLRFGTFSDGLLDYQQFMGERERVTGDWEYLLRVVSFDRIRPESTRVNFLFRPALMGFLGLEDIFFRENLPVSGYISIGLHLLVVLSLFFICLRVATLGPALLLCLAFSIYAHGAFMILWRMIAPYTVAMLLWLSGCCLLSGLKPLPTARVVAATVLFMLSAFFHENAAFTALVLTIILTGSKIRHIRILFSFTCVFYFGASLLDFAYRQSTGGLFSHYFDGVAPDLVSWVSMGATFFNRTCQALGNYLVPFFIPQTASFSWELGQPFFFACGLAILAAVLVALKRLYVGRGRWGAPDGGKGLFWFLWLSYPLVLVILLSAFRATPRGYYYFSASSYYRYELAFFLVPVLARYLSRTTFPVWGKVLLLVLISNQVVFGALRLHKQIAMEIPGQRERSTNVERAVAILSEGRCLLWDEQAANSQPTSALPAVYLYRRSCREQSGTPISYEELRRLL